MGTSQSSSGSPSGVPLVPPWVPDVPSPPPNDEPGDGATDNGEPKTSVAPEQAAPTMPEIAPMGRWRGARHNLGKFARSGDATDLRSGLRHYVSGLGGTRAGARRFGGTTNATGRLYSALSSLASGQPFEPGSPLDPILLEGRSAREVMDAIIEAVQPVDGTLDAEASRASINDALTELVKRFPGADLRQLSQEQREFVIERFVAYDVYRRFSLDVGGSIKSKAPSIAAALSRLREAKEYIRETVAASFRQLREVGQRLRSGLVPQVVNKALQKALRVFEEYV